MVEATRPPTSMRAFAPKRTPCGLTSQTPPLEDRVPRMLEGSLPTTRLSTWLAALGCSKRTLFCVPMEKLFQLTTAFGLLVIVILLPLVTIPAVPLITAAPVGSCAHAEPATVTQAAPIASASGCKLKLARVDVLALPRE